MLERRKRYLIRPAWQLRYVAMVLLPMLFVCAAQYYLMYIVLMNELALPEILAHHFLPAFRRINMVLVVAAPVVMLALALWIIRVTNRVAGPIYRLESELKRLAEGETVTRVDFRRGDDLVAVSDQLNRAIGQISPPSSTRTSS